MNNWLTFDMIRVWLIKSDKCKLLLVVVLILLLLFLFCCPWSSCLFSVQDFCNLLDFRFKVKTFLYFSKDIANFRFLLHNCLFSCWLQNSFFSQRVPFFWHSYRFPNHSRNWFSTLNAPADTVDMPHLARFPTCAHLVIFRFLDEKLKKTTTKRGLVEKRS